MFEISSLVQDKQVLFDFMAAGDVLDVIISAGIHLGQIGNGER